MIKHLLSIFLTVTFVGTAFADSPVFDYTYANGTPGYYGKAQKETVDVAMCIDNPSMAGMKVIGIKAYIATTEGISNPSIWLSNQLSVENKQNKPDIASYSVTASKTQMGGGISCGLLELSLEQPYTLTDQPLYLGYSITVDQLSTDEQKRPIVVTDDVNPNGFFLHTTGSVLKWADYSERTGSVAFIVAQIEGAIPEYALGFNSYQTIYTDPGKNFDVTFSVSNPGVNTIENLNYSYSYDNGATQLGYLELDTPLPNSSTNTYNLTLPFNGVAEAGPHYLTVKVTDVNGYPNEATTSSLTALVNVLPYYPQHRPLVEEYTGLWCGWCPRGYIAMEMLDEDLGDEGVVICYHDGDAMGNLDTYPISVKGLPAASVDRLAAVDPYYGSYGEASGVEYGIYLDAKAAQDNFTLSEIEVKATVEDNIINVESNVRFIREYPDANYQIGYVLVTNGISSKDWVQANYYARLTGYAGTPLEVLTTWPARVSDLVFNTVAANHDAMLGVEGSIPSDIKYLQPISHQYSFDVTDNELVQNIDNLTVAAFVIDKTTGLIDNANKCRVVSAGVDSITADNEIISTEFYDLTGIKVSSSSPGILIRVDRYSDGTLKSRKVRIER